MHLRGRCAFTARVCGCCGEYHGLRAPGTNIPGIITAGTFHAHEGRVFWNVHRPANAIAIRLHDENYVKIVVEVEDPDATIALIGQARTGSI